MQRVKFENRLAEFRHWCRQFHQLTSGRSVEHYRRDDMYMCIEHICGRSGFGVYDFVGVTFRKYDPETESFKEVPPEEEFVCKHDLFSKKISAYAKKHKTRFYD